MTDLKTKRVAAGISGSVLCLKVGVSRSRLSQIERGFTKTSPEEAARLEQALDELIRAQSVLKQTAAALGWPVSGDVP